MIQVDDEILKLKIIKNGFNLPQLVLIDKNHQIFAKLSVNSYSTTLKRDEFILKNYSENEVVAKKLIELNLIKKTGKYVLIGRKTCPICRIKIPLYPEIV